MLLAGIQGNFGLDPRLKRSGVTSWYGVAFREGYTLEVDPGFRKRVPFSSSVGERKIMNHFVVNRKYYA
jgi:hypothetical protein